MPDFGFTEAFRTNEFVVEIEGIESPGITSVSGLGEGNVEAIDQSDGGSNVTHKISSGLVTYDDVTLERNMDGTQTDDDFRAWFE
jgi:phage tail-like protein